MHVTPCDPLSILVVPSSLQMAPPIVVTCTDPCACLQQKQKHTNSEAQCSVCGASRQRKDKDEAASKSHQLRTKSDSRY